MLLLGAVGLHDWIAEVLAEEDEPCEMTEAELNAHVRPIVHFTRWRGGGTFVCMAPHETHA